MTEGSNTGYGESADTADAPSGADLIDGTPGNDRPDGGEQDTVLVTDDEAQRDDDVTRPGNSAG
ncbi:hypothetical protein [Modestobacter sp. SSW1-42]|uniref:hypothetical protein n=1 Tax=Modestobacter sp. SSW1-42 TaxID=596372 RepID=UPI0039859243